MRILVLGGTHGNEPLGPRLVADLKKRPIPGVDAIIANPRALRQNTRFTQKDLNRSFPGSATSTMYEERRAWQLLKLCKKYDLVLDFHNTLCSDNDCVFVGQDANPLLLQVASTLQLTRVIVADYDCINKYTPNCISLEISVTSERMDIKLWRDALEVLAQATLLPDARDLTFYRYAMTITTAQRDQLQLDPKRLPVFKPMPRRLAKTLGLPSPAYPIFVGKNYTDGVFAGIVVKTIPEIQAAPKALQ